MKLVKLNKPRPPNMAGEVCAFVDEVADAMIAAGDAALMETPEEVSQFSKEHPPKERALQPTTLDYMDPPHGTAQVPVNSESAPAENVDVARLPEEAVRGEPLADTSKPSAAVLKEGEELRKRNPGETVVPVEPDPAAQGNGAPVARAAVVSKPGQTTAVKGPVKKD